MCLSCEVLRQTNADLREQVRHLTIALVKKNEPVIEARESTEELQPIRPKHIPFSVRREMLEQQDREKAQAIRQQKETERLEAELLKSGAAGAPNAG